MTRRMPVLPNRCCGDCPLEQISPRWFRCAANSEGLVRDIPDENTLRTYACVADELAWRNVAAGLAMVACYEHGLRLGKSYSENAKVLGWAVMSVTHKSPPQREPGR